MKPDPPVSENLLDRVAFVTARDIPADAVIVVKAARRLTDEQVMRIEEVVRSKLPGRQVIVLPPDLDLDVLVPV